ncbi:Fc.00g044650.m01.CDS01 [Cosmosporella sp. VM-42]
MNRISTSLARASARKAPYSRAIIHPTRLAASRLSFATQPVPQNKQPNKPQSPPETPSPGNPEYPAFSFEALGVSKNMKIFLMVVLSIFGTIETWFWCQTVWRWWKGSQPKAIPEGKS